MIGEYQYTDIGGEAVLLCHSCDDEWPESALVDGECPECRDYEWHTMESDWP